MTELQSARPLDRQVLRELVRERLLQEIVSGHLAQGTRIVEKRFAQQYGVSPGPLREALRDLQLFGLVETKPFRGARIRTLSDRDLQEMRILRATLEGTAARIVAAAGEAAVFRALDQQVQKMREAAVSSDRRGLFDAHLEFHHLIVRAAGNGMLERVFHNMGLGVTTLTCYTVQQSALAAIAESHPPLVAAIRSGDPSVAEQVVARHVLEAGGLPDPQDRDA